MRSSDALAEYKQKRHFERTSEPGARIAAPGGRSFVVQKHDASRLHYDFRLELDGVLKSWAVPKGPSLDPKIKRLAVEVEDHPVEYGEFEGVIPEGEYGGGTVLLWDVGTWEPVGDARAGYRSGKLKFKLFGEKLQGGWILVRSSSSRNNGDGKEWLLIKERDDFAQASDVGDILEDAPRSVFSRRDLKEIASAKDRVWPSRTVDSSRSRLTSKTNQGPQKRAPKNRSVRQTSRSRLASVSKVAQVTGAEPAELPASIQIELATLTEELPEGDQWLHEIKFDGYRMVCRIDGDDVKFISRNQQDWTDRLKPLASEVQRLGISTGLFDGEVVCLRSDGTTDFQALQNAFRDGRASDLHYYVFDVVYLDGYSLMAVPLEERKRVLRGLIATSRPSDSRGSKIHFSDHLEGTGKELLNKACGLHLEGIISKRRDRPYRAGRGADWLKIKCLKSDEFVIGGFTEPTGSRNDLGALLVGYFDQQDRLKYSGKVGTGFDHKTLTSLLKKLSPLEQKQSPFSDLTRKTGPVRTAHWVKPVCVAQVTYGSRTTDGKLRHASFQGLREDKPATEVHLEKAVPVTRLVRKNEQGQKPKHAKEAKSDQRLDQLRGVELTSPQKLLYPDEEITKLDLAAYYASIAEWIMPHIVNRPLSLVRCPDGIEGESFFQKHPGTATPSELGEVSIEEKNGPEKYSVVKDVRGLISLAQISALEIHAWGCRIDNIEKPDRLVFDLDPDPTVAWQKVVESARQIREFLEALGLKSFVKTTGGKGLHLVVPIERRHGWEEVKSFCRLIAETIAQTSPGLYTAKMTKSARTNRIFIDYLRNGRGATAVVPYSTRARAGATVSTPLTWKELTPQITSDYFSLNNIQKRLKSLRKDPWAEINTVRQSLTKPMKKLLSLNGP